MSRKELVSLSGSAAEEGAIGGPGISYFPMQAWTRTAAANQWRLQYCAQHDYRTTAGCGCVVVCTVSGFGGEKDGFEGRTDSRETRGWAWSPVVRQDPDRTQAIGELVCCSEEGLWVVDFGNDQALKCVPAPDLIDSLNLAFRANFKRVVSDCT